MRRLLIAVSFALLATAVSAAPAEKKKGGGDSYLQLPTLTATIFRPDGSRGVLTVDLGLDIPNPAMRLQANAYVPILRDAFTRVLLSYAPSIPVGAPPNLDVLGAQLQRATDDTLKKRGAILLLGSILEN
jgi:hypothetical protein